MDTTAAGTPTGLLIAGEWRDNTADDVVVVVENPADTTIVAEVPAASVADVESAVAAAPW